MVQRYEYKGRLKDSAYFRALVERDAAPSLGITEYPDRFIIYFENPLTDAQKTKLDSLVAENPVPTIVYEYGSLDLPEEIEKAVGVRPVYVDYDEVRNHARISFDKTLTHTQEIALKTFLETLTVKRIMKKR